ncbi:response regulator [Tropicimonas sp. IMCC34043]|uniref:response regulator n=1 Tax=Tropicimonas sp. IMCC34043 TaxID=2248760 RepID=UPI000E2887CE|nr:response regulator [Tropicimonas sp. IMCC34043]
MQVLIVESNKDLGWVWKRHLERSGQSVTLAQSQEEAVDVVCGADLDVIILDVVLEEGSAFAIADYASYHSPRTKVVFVTNTTFFSDGSIFQIAPNACAYLRTATPPEDLALMVEHFGGVRM